jgi:hypothetical protein
LPSLETKSKHRNKKQSLNNEQPILKNTSGQYLIEMYSNTKTTIQSESIQESTIPQESTITETHIDRLKDNCIPEIETIIVDDWNIFEEKIETFENECIIQEENMCGKRLVGLDLEWISRNIYPHRFQEKGLNPEIQMILCKFILCNSKTCFIFDLCQLDSTKVPRTLIEILISNMWIKSGVNVLNDVKYMCNWIGISIHKNPGCFDVGEVAKKLQITRPNLENIYNIFVLLREDLKKKKCKKISLSDWSTVLNPKQKMYCIMDGYMSFMTGKHMLHLNSLNLI